MLLQSSQLMNTLPGCVTAYLEPWGFFCFSCLSPCGCSRTNLPPWQTGTVHIRVVLEAGATGKTCDQAMLARLVTQLILANVRLHFL